MSRRHEVGVGVLVLSALGLLAFMALQVGAIRGLGPRVEVDAIFPDGAGLSEGAVVSIAGVEVGRVESMAVEFDRARARLSLDAAAQVRTDATVAIRARSVLGEKYVEIRPVSRDAPLVETGDVLTDVRGQMEIDEMVDGLSPLLKAIDPEAIRTLSDALRNDPERATRMLADTETLLHNAALTSEKLPAAVEEARETLAAARRTAASGDATLAQVNDTLARVQARVDAVPPEQVPQLLAELEAAARDGRAVMRKADGAAIKADALLDNWKDADWEALRRMAQEEGVFIRLTPYEGK